MGRETFELQRTDSICQPPELQLLDYVRTNQPVYKIQSFLIDNPEALTNIIGHPFDKPILYIACNELANTVSSEIVETLIKSGANLYYTDELHNYKEALHFAVLGGNPRILQIIIKRLKLDKINSLSNGNTALNLLIKEGNSETPDFVECIRLLLKGGIDVNKSDNKNLTPIFWAAKKGYRDAVEVILHESKQEVDIESNKLRGKSAKDYIIENGFADVLENLPSKSGNNNENSNPSDVLFNFLKEYNEDGFVNCKYLADFVESDDGVFTLLQSATKKGLVQAVEALLNNGADPNKTTPKTKATPIELAAAEGYHQILALFLKHKRVDIPSHILMEILRNIDNEITHENVNHNLCYSLLMEHKDKLNMNIPDKYNNTALHLAAKYGGTEKALDLLRAGASMACKNKFGILPVEDIDANTLEIHLDECLEVNVENNINKENFIALYNYRTLMPPRRLKYENKINKDAHDTEAANKLIAEEMQQLASETQVISYMSKSPELRHLLKHPVITSFLYIKWHRIRWFFYTNLAFYIAFCLSLILYILVVYSNQNNTEHKDGDSILLGFLWAFFILLVLREIFQIAVSPKTYFCSFENWLELALIFLTGIILIRSPTEAVRKQVSAFAILLAAFELVILIGQHPKMSTNIVMLRTVSLNFFKFLLWYSILILAFSLSFYTLFKDTDKDDSKNSTDGGDDDEQHFFIDPGISLFKTIVMLTGEFDASDIDFQVYPITSHIIFMLFVFMIAIILFNLLNGLAVSDTQLIKSNSELVGHITRIEHIAYIESMLLGHILPSKVIEVIQRYCCCLPYNVTSKFIMPGILVKRVCLFPYFLHDYRMMTYPNRNAMIALPNNECSDSESEKCIANCSNIYLDKQTAKRTKQLIKAKKEILEQKKREQGIIEMQELLRKEQQIILNKLDYIITNMSVNV